MSEVKYKICSKCGAQMQIEEGVACTSIPPMFRYRCPVCGNVEFDLDRYPMPKVVNNLSLKPSIEFIPTFDWEAFRAEAAKDILCALLMSGNTDLWSNVTKEAIRAADVLIEQLKNGKE